MWSCHQPHHNRSCLLLCPCQAVGLLFWLLPRTRKGQLKVGWEMLNHEKAAIMDLVWGLGSFLLACWSTSGLRLLSGQEKWSPCPFNRDLICRNLQLVFFLFSNRVNMLTSLITAADQKWPVWTVDNSTWTPWGKSGISEAPGPTWIYGWACITGILWLHESVISEEQPESSVFISIPYCECDFS